MNDAPDWLPNLIRLDQFSGSWEIYVDAVHDRFSRDFIQSQPKFEGLWVRCPRDPMDRGREAGFWHCVQEGPIEKNRTPDLRRCERIAWVRAIIENSDDSRIQSWPTRRGSDRRWVLWFNEEFAVVLAERQRKRDGFQYMQLITAYCTDREHTRRKLRKERDTAQNG